MWVRRLTQGINLEEVLGVLTIQTELWKKEISTIGRTTSRPRVPTEPPFARTSNQPEAQESPEE